MIIAPFHDKIGTDCEVSGSGRIYMDSRDYEKILDSIPGAGIYVVREDNHEILYYNSRMKQMVPKVQKGIACDRL